MRIVVKVGTSTLAYATGRMNLRRIEQLCKALSDLKNMRRTRWCSSPPAPSPWAWASSSLKERPQDMPGKQAAAAVGQCELMYAYDQLFSEYSHVDGSGAAHGQRRGGREPPGERPSTR